MLFICVQRELIIDELYLAKVGFLNLTIRSDLM